MKWEVGRVNGGQIPVPVPILSRIIVIITWPWSPPRCYDNNRRRRGRISIRLDIETMSIQLVFVLSSIFPRVRDSSMGTKV